MPTPSRPRLSVLILLFVLGILLGLVGAGVIALEHTLGSVTIPWGLVLAVLGVACTVRGAIWYVGSRRGGVAVLLGWLIPTFAFSAVNPGGDVILTDERRTYVYLLGTFAFGLIAVSWPLPAGAAALAAPSPRPDPLDDVEDAADVDEVDPSLGIDGAATTGDTAYGATPD